MFCSRCGTEVEKPSQFCPTCGLDLRITTPVQAIATGDVTEVDIVREALNAEYEILEELGRGGMAIVFRARDRHLERDVAIKVLPFSLAFDAEFVERFQREARTAAQLEHPNIIPIYRVGRSGRVIYIVMKLIRGASLSRMLIDQTRLPPAQIRRVLIEAGNAMGYAAKRGIVHRDIKPDNIMFDEFGQAVVMDFGIAKAATGQKLTGTGMSIGTPHYMSPEQARAQPIDGRSDIYSLGVVAYQSLVGEVPYDGEDSFAIGYKQIMDPLPNPPLEGPEARRLFEVIKRMLMKDPNDRFQDTDELVMALEGEPMQTRRSTGRATASRLGIPNLPTSPIESLEGWALPPASPPGVVGVPAVSRRSVARRPVGQRKPEASSSAWVWVMLLLLGAAGGSAYYYRDRLGTIFPGLGIQDSTAVSPDTSGVATTPVDSATSPPANSLSVTTKDTTPVVPVVGPLSRDSLVPPPSGDSGTVRITGLPRNSTIMIDTKPVYDPLIRLPVGPHELAITAPGFQFYKDTIIVSAGQPLVLSPQLARFGEAVPPVPPAMRPGAEAALNCDVPSLANQYGRACYDTRPIPVGGSRVPVTSAIQGIPTPSVLLVKVGADGKTIKVLPRTPSSDPAFESLAQTFAQNLTWKPATKNGAPVDGWTQFAFQPDR